MGEKNIGPKVHESRKTFWKTTVVRNKMNGTVLNAYMRKIELSKGDMKKIIKLVLKMHKEGYYHGHINVSRVVWKQLEDGKNFKLIGFKKMGKIEDKLDYKDILSKIKTIHKDDWDYDWHYDTKDNIIIVDSYEEDIRDLFELLTYHHRNRGNNERDDVYYGAMKHSEHMYKFSKWFRETVEAEVKNLNNKNKKRNNNNRNNN
jgi:hypothetical protein